MKSFLVESYTPRSAVIDEIEARARRAAGGTAVHYVRSIFVPADEICFHLLDGPAAGDVGDVIRAAGIQAQRIVEVDEA
jgi:hypothetical protein